MRTEQRPGGEPGARTSLDGDKTSVPDARPVILAAVVVDLHDLPPHDAGHVLERALSDLPQGAEVVLKVSSNYWCTALPDAIRRAGRVRLEASSAAMVRTWRDALDKHIGRR